MLDRNEGINHPYYPYREGNVDPRLLDAVNQGIHVGVNVAEDMAGRMDANDLDCAPCGLQGTVVTVAAAVTTGYSVHKNLKAIKNIVYDHRKFLKSLFRLSSTATGYVIGMTKGSLMAANAGMSPVIGTVIGGILGAGISTMTSKYFAKLVTLITVMLGWRGPRDNIVSATNPAKYQPKKTLNAQDTAAIVHLFHCAREQKNRLGCFGDLLCTPLAVQKDEFNALIRTIEKDQAAALHATRHQQFIGNFLWNGQRNEWAYSPNQGQDIALARNNSARFGA